MFLKVYFWIFLVLNIVTASQSIVTIKQWNLVDFSHLLQSILLNLALYSYVFKPRILMLQINTWRIIAIILISLYLIPVTSSPQYQAIKEYSSYFVFLALGVSILITLPAYYSLYKLAFPKGKQRKKSK